MENGVIVNCSKCGNPINCNAQDIRQCGCSTILLSAQTKSFLMATSFDCLCNACLTHYENLVTLSNANKQDGLVEGQDYYMEDGYMVFTELYHVSRGSCCQSGCRHCAYGFKH